MRTPGMPRSFAADFASSKKFCGREVNARHSCLFNFDCVVGTPPRAAPSITDTENEKVALLLHRGIPLRQIRDRLRRGLRIHHNRCLRIFFLQHIREHIEEIARRRYFPLSISTIFLPSRLAARGLIPSVFGGGISPRGFITSSVTCAEAAAAQEQAGDKPARRPAANSCFSS